jgi:hypothetical protein
LAASCARLAHHRRLLTRCFYWWKETHLQLPPNIVFGNGRLEADEIDIDTKFAERIAEL